MTLKEQIVAHSGTVYRFSKETKIHETALYGLLRRKRAVSKGILGTLKGTLGNDVVDCFDEDGVLLQK
jgi:hypothetical protein